MSKDPFQDREAEKYASPIASREFILEEMKKRPAPMSREDIAQALKISGEEIWKHYVVVYGLWNEMVS